MAVDANGNLHIADIAENVVERGQPFVRRPLCRSCVFSGDRLWDHHAGYHGALRRVRVRRYPVVAIDPADVLDLSHGGVPAGAYPATCALWLLFAHHYAIMATTSTDYQATTGAGIITIGCVSLGWPLDRCVVAEQRTLPRLPDAVTGWPQRVVPLKSDRGG